MRIGSAACAQVLGRSSLISHVGPQMVDNSSSGPRVPSVLTVKTQHRGGHESSHASMSKPLCWEAWA